MNMREKIARIIASLCDEREDKWESWLGWADAVLDAMRDPTLEMLEKAEDAYVPTYTGTPVAAPGTVWQAMIDAAKEQR